MSHKDFYRIVVAKLVKCSSCSSTSPSQSSSSVPEEYLIHAGSNAGCGLKGPKEGWGVVLGCSSNLLGIRTERHAGVMPMSVAWATHQFLEIE